MPRPLTIATFLVSVGVWVTPHAMPAVTSPNNAPSAEAAPSRASDHWAFRPPSRPLPPEVVRARWVRNPIDAFIAKEHEQHGLVPQPEASRELLVRRLYIDLIGLPPSEADLDAVRGDHSPQWYEGLVDRLLADPRHGERWARHWMDIWRYSDWWGLGDQLRNSQKHLWHWRDWIVESLNGNLPYDEMVRLMLAADELHPADPSRLRATGFLARNYFLFNRNQWMDEVVEHVGKGFLGLTLNCAKCHEHKYDPVVQMDYYRMRAFFEPYQARVDVLPGEADLTRDGLPRVFEGPTVPVTYRFVRGDEGSPDKSTPVMPGVPAFLEFGPIEIHPVPLPLEAWQPERQPWVLEAHLSAAAQRVASSLVAVQQAEARARQDPDSPEGKAGLEAARAGAQLAAAERAGVERRVAAMRLSWITNDSEGALARYQTARVEAVKAEREAQLARRRQAVADLRLKLVRAGKEGKEAVQKELTEAMTAESAATLAAAGPVGPTEGFARLTGGAWTPTRFLSSTTDDPPVEFAPRSTGRRTALANWITDPRNPLTARVAVNHIWMRHMGTPLVATVFEFGRKGARPTHPELLDWLASELVGSGWDMKHIHRLIVTSATYRLSSSVAGAEGSLARDPDNRYWWHRVPIRLEAQVVRDALLAHSGQLDATMGGPPIPPAAQAESKRRSLYFYHSNNDHNLFLSMFDDAGVKECYVRNQSIVPQQALALSNSRLVHDAAPAIAARLSAPSSQPGSGPRAAGEVEFVRRAFRLLLGAPATTEELEASLSALREWDRVESSLPASPGGETHSRSRLVWALLNHNDFVTLR
ncbi:MAG TPA: hypothetical protein DCM86_07190 [Verrucomicrobiales bacterium]|mgnify:CR=1 FL=1|nr:hypothetical protein [Verrucomicrobiales bacterium]